MKKQNKLRLNPEELWQRLKDASRNLTEKLCASAPRAKAALNAMDGHTNCWFNLVNRSQLIKKKNYDIILDSILILQHFPTSA